MREIKFRAWDETEKHMYNWENLLNQNLKNIFTIPEQCGYNIMQYTGLHDKNNKEIYEGDVLQIDVDKAWVRWNNKYGYFQLVPIGDYYFDSPVIGHILEYSEAEVIGSIYENKELLNETNR